MAKADYKCPECGDWIRVTGVNRADADRKAQWAEASGKLCYECYAKDKAASIEKERRAALEAALVAKADAGLPDLVGSEKQVAWAETIRAEQHAALLKLIDRGITPAIQKAFREEVDAWMAETSAHAWIERRDTRLDKRWIGDRITARALTDADLAQQIQIAIVAVRIHRGAA